MSQASINVIREGKEQTVATTSIVRGDIVILGTGDVVPADMFLFSAEDLKVSEMCLTGEPDDVAKTWKQKKKEAGDHGGEEKLTPQNMVFSGCPTTNGKGIGIVVETGMGTRIGQIAALMAGDGGEKKTCGCMPDTSGSQTPLQKNVQTLGAKIGVLAIVVCILVFIVGVVLETEDPNNDKTPPWLYMILISVTLAVAAIPEGIPLCVTISLSIGCSAMVKKNVLVRKLAAVETLGSASVICSDKTGTLTEGKMTMVEAWSGDVQYDVSGKGFDPTVGKFTRKNGGADGNGDVNLVSAVFSAMLCCNTRIEKVVENGETKYEPKGNSSEAPIIVAGMKIGFKPEEIGKDCKRVLEVPFSSSRKMMLTVNDVTGRETLCQGGLKLPAGSKFYTVCKGAPNYIIDICTHISDEQGCAKAFSAEKKDAVLRTVDEYSAKALRVLAIAYRTFEKLPLMRTTTT
jgi:magnesium-transporting ATPase (P-type)